MYHINIQYYIIGMLLIPIYAIPTRACTGQSLVLCNEIAHNGYFHSDTNSCSIRRTKKEFEFKISQIFSVINQHEQH